MFVKIGSGIFNSEDIRAVIFSDEEITVYLKNISEGEEIAYTVDSMISANSTQEKTIDALNAKETQKSS